MKLKLLFSIFIAYASLVLSAQQVGITGTVTDAKDGSPLPGVTVMIDKSTVGTITDVDGKFTFKQVAPDAVIVFSFLGYASQKIAVTGQTTITV
jgi:hypothetical protein